MMATTSQGTNRGIPRASAVHGDRQRPQWRGKEAPVHGLMITATGLALPAPGRSSLFIVRSRSRRASGHAPWPPIAASIEPCRAPHGAMQATPASKALRLRKRTLRGFPRSLHSRHCDAPTNIHLVAHPIEHGAGSSPAVRKLSATVLPCLTEAPRNELRELDPSGVHVATITSARPIPAQA